MKTPKVLLIVAGVTLALLAMGGITGAIWYIAYKVFKQFAC